MITSINNCNYTSFQGIKPEKVCRKVINTSFGYTPKGISKSPVRLEYDGNSPFFRGLFCIPNATINRCDEDGLQTLTTLTYGSVLCVGYEFFSG